MSDYVPTAEEVRRAWGVMRFSRSWDEANAEFRRFLAVHDQGILDEERDHTMTAREHLEAAWEAAYEIPEGQVIPKGTRYLLRISDHEVAAVEAGIDLREGPSARTLDPLPPVIPEDCDYVWASVPDDRGDRSIWTRTSDGRWESRMPRGNCTVQYPEADLIDPKPVPEEER